MTQYDVLFLFLLINKQLPMYEYYICMNIYKNKWLQLNTLQMLLIAPYADTSWVLSIVITLLTENWLLHVTQLRNDDCNSTLFVVNCALIYQRYY